jgi:hypothetical protein
MLGYESVECARQVVQHHLPSVDRVNIDSYAACFQRIELRLAAVRNGVACRHDIREDAT